ncbi:type II toxin-antitoxin system VapC family toxin [Mucilaginibacter celer]|uniref:PIN domain-containing protein n=1 Tax=Mucilaginibacter celer TaxID=2305508 RepID=A0A494VH78_9SPHI|nr:type II toxin-antitoxin system VapC family toxin [Mucilaginibacter celer]AYL93996.1 PIN domain-containing protein [Mucilaginibacter celer]
MNYLLDTHAFLWYIDGSTELSSTAKAIVEDKTTVKFISTATLWEVSIKISLNKLNLTLSFESLPDFIASNRFNDLAIEFKHLQQLGKLEHHHRDPFDRLIIA